MHRVVPLIFAASLLLAPSLAVAQAGSAGGTVGKQDKSASGGADATATPRKKPAAAVVPAQTTANSSCRNVVGEWKWYRGLIVVTFSTDGALRNTLPDHGTWTCSGGALSGVWDTGVKEQYKLSADGNSLLVNSSWGGGVTFAATRQGH